MSKQKKFETQKQAQQRKQRNRAKAAEAYYEKRRQLQRLTEKVPAEAIKIDARSIIAQLGKDDLSETIAKWYNCQRLLDDIQYVDQQDEIHKVLTAIEEIWSECGASEQDGWFPWPSTDAHGGSGVVEGKGWPETGVLRWMGYSVSNAEGLSTSKRRKILEGVFESQLPPLLSPVEMKEWGEPASARRLQKMAVSIASFVKLKKRDGRQAYDDAIRNWESDLLFLKQKYYVGKFGFEWPTTVI